jgi:hypothetical protein
VRPFAFLVLGVATYYAARALLGADAPPLAAFALALTMALLVTALAGTNRW